MGRLHVAVAECNYKELDRQLKQQFIHGLNDKVMLDKIIRQLTAKNNNKQVMSEGVLAWAKGIEVQRAQAAVLNDITESHQFDKIKVAKKSKESHKRHTPSTTGQQQPSRYCGGDPCTKTVPSLWKGVCQLWKDGTFQEGVLEQERPSGAWAGSQGGTGS